MPAEETMGVHFRAPTELIARIDVQAEALGLSRAGMLRVLLHQSMGDDIYESFIKEAYYAIQPLLRHAVSEGAKVAMAEMPRILTEALESTGLMKKQFDMPPRSQGPHADAEE